MKRFAFLFMAISLHTASSAQAGTGFWCQGSDLYGEPFWLDIDLVGNATSATYTHQHFSGSTGETSYEKTTQPNLDCELHSAFLIKCTDASGRIRIRSLVTQNFHAYEMNLSSAYDPANTFTAQFAFCKEK